MAPIKPPSIFAWIYALVPLLGTAVEAALQTLAPDMSLPTSALNAAYTGLYIGTTMADRTALKEAVTKGQLGDLEGRTPPSFWWCMLGPVYLWRRATFLRQPRIHFWVWWVCLVLTIAVVFRDDIGTTIRGERTATCQSAMATENVKSFFARIPRMQTDSITAAGVHEIQQVSVTETRRTCTATVHGSDGVDRRIEYSLEVHADRQTYIEVKLQ